MYSNIKTCILQGLEGNIVNVETDISRGLPTFTIVGLADVAIKESKERVWAAIKNSDFEFPLNKITINLAPANIKKEGSQIDLAIATGILKSSLIISKPIADGTAIFGELSLDGEIIGVQGALPMVIALRELGIKKCIIPNDNKMECGFISGIEIIPVKNLVELVNYLNGIINIVSFQCEDKNNQKNVYGIDFSDISGQKNLKRGLEIAAASNHPVLLLGPPGSGKTMSAKRIPTILPELNFEESVEVTKIYSITGNLNTPGLIRERPFRSPHHTASAVSLIGGGRNPSPGEVSLAHNGILFLDELPEFSRNVLEVLRQPMEDGVVHISRANASLDFPANFMLVASMNPCPCGFYGDANHECSCSINEINRYLGKISSPLLDRIDIHIEVSSVKFNEMSRENAEESSEEIKKRVKNAVDIQMERFKDSNIYYNSQMDNKQIKKFCKLDDKTEKIIEMAFNKYNFSARTYNKLLKIARTIADLDNSENIMEKHMLESIRYRTLDSKYWNR